MNKAQKAVLKASLNDEKRTIRELKQVYGQTKKDVEERIRNLSSRTDMENLQSIIYQKKYQEALKKQLDDVLDKLNTGQFDTISDYLNVCYENGYIGNMYDLHHQGIPMTVPINQKKVVKALQTDTKLSSRRYKGNPLKGRLAEDIDKLKASIRAELSRSVANGSSWNEVAVKIAKGMNNPFDKAYRNALLIARTEGHRIQQSATLDAMYVATDKGANVVKQWDSTLDRKTRKAHMEADGQIRELDEPFDVWGEKMDAPAVGGSAKNVCNCRCVLLQRARWALDETELKTLQERAEFFGLDKSQSFEDFKQKYLKLPENYKILTLEDFKKMKHTISKEERKIVYGRGHFSGYINSSNARKMNAIIREDKKLPSDYQKIADTLQSIIDRNVINDNIIVTRYISADSLEAIAGVAFPTPSLKMKVEKYWELIEDIPNQIQKGKVYIEKAFLSTSGVAEENVMINKGVKLEIKVPKGTNCYITTNNKESEIIFGKNTRLKIVGSRVEDNRTSKHKVVLECIME